MSNFKHIVFAQYSTMQISNLIHIHNEILTNPASNSPGHRQSSNCEHVLTCADSRDTMIGTAGSRYPIPRHSASIGTDTSTDPSISGTLLKMTVILGTTVYMNSSNLY